MRSAIPWQEEWGAGLVRVLSSCFFWLPITTVNEHWAFLPASARDTNPVMSRGTGMTVPAYPLLVFDCFLVLKSLGRRKSPKTVNIAMWGSMSIATRPSVACEGRL